MTKSTVCFQNNQNNQSTQPTQTTATWDDEHHNLLEFAESLALNPSFGCRLGHCGGCKMNIETGSVKYLFRSQIDLDDDEALLCCSVPSSELLVLSQVKSY